MHPNMAPDLAPPYSITTSAGANGTGGAVMSGGNASERCVVRDRIQPSIMARLAMDVVFELGNHELLITDYAFDKIAD
jgi:hypothetical protein